MAARRLQAQNSTRGVSLATRATRAASPWARFVGLMGRRTLPPGEGLHLSPCSSVHTWFMRIPIDVLYLDRDHRVVKIVPALRPWRFSWGARGAHSVFELPAGTIAATNTAVGDQIEFT
jgi:uncharacterized membrane protein (UPF0127 family)